MVLILHADDLCNQFEDLLTVNCHLDTNEPDGVYFDRIVQLLSIIRGNTSWTGVDFKSSQADVFPNQEKSALE